MDESSRSSDKLKQAVEVFWETFPPFWRIILAHIRQVSVEQFDITVEQFHILRHIRKGRNSVSALAEAKNISRPAISHSVDLLVTRGLIVRSTDPLDRRHVKLDLTAKGNALLDAIFGDTRQWMMKMLAPLSSGEIEALTGSMESLRKIL